MKTFENHVDMEIKRLLTQKNYPCVAALQSYHRKDYWVKTYEDFGERYQRPELRRDLLSYLEEYKKTESQHFSFWAVFNDLKNLNEDQFEMQMWNELSSLSSAESRSQDYDPRFSDDPLNKNFCFSIGGKAFFVVGLHPESSRRSRRFPWPALVFNTFEQFDTLKTNNQYDSMTKVNRLRDKSYQGDANPMVLLYSEIWESIQFSGKKNEASWKCPFHFRNVAGNRAQ